MHAVHAAHAVHAVHAVHAGPHLCRSALDTTVGAAAGWQLRLLYTLCPHAKGLDGLHDNLLLHWSLAWLTTQATSVLDTTRCDNKLTLTSTLSLASFIVPFIADCAKTMSCARSLEAVVLGGGT